MGETVVRTLTCAAAAGLLAACAALSGDIDDGGRAQRQVEDAPTVIAAQDDVFGETSIEIARQPFDFKRKDAESADDAPTRKCDATRWDSLLGQDIIGVDRRVLPSVYRVVPHDAAVSQEFREERLSIFLDENSIVTRIECG